MDGSRFDTLSRSLARDVSRRRILMNLAGFITGAILGGRLQRIEAACPAGQYQGSGNRCLCKATGRPPGPNGCPCGAGQSTCGDACLTAGACCIGGTAAPAGTLNPSNDCQACQPRISATAWTNRAPGASCGEGRCGGTCDGAGTCVVPTPVATARDCGGRCYWDIFPECHNTVTICGQEVRCPHCQDWAAQGCSVLTLSVGRDEGSLGGTCYFLTGEEQQDSGCEVSTDCTPLGVCVFVSTGGLGSCLPICLGGSGTP